MIARALATALACLGLLLVTGAGGHDTLAGILAQGALGLCALAGAIPLARNDNDGD